LMKKFYVDVLPNG